MSFTPTDCNGFYYDSLYSSSQQFLSGELCPVMTSFSGLSCFGALSRSFLPGPYVGRQRTTSIQVKKITKITYVVFLLIMLTGSCLASPRIEQTDEGSAVYFKSRFCQPISQSELRKRMGGLFESSHYSDKRSASDNDNVDDDDDEEEESDYFDTLDQRVGDSDVVDYSDKDNDPYSTDTTTHHPSFMRRKRDTDDGIEENTLKKLLNKDKKSASDSALHLKLFLSGNNNKKARRQLKKKIRKARKNIFKNPPWECKMDMDWLRMKPGFFPSFVRSGKCKTNKCFYRLYDCIPKKYAIKLLKRDPDQCNPIPTIGLNATYEERWFYVSYYVTVGCDCSKKLKQRRKGR